jgi:hypothetical protein
LLQWSFDHDILNAEAKADGWYALITLLTAEQSDPAQVLIRTPTWRPRPSGIPAGLPVPATSSQHLNSAATSRAPRRFSTTDVPTRSRR